MKQYSRAAFLRAFTGGISDDPDVRKQPVNRFPNSSGASTAGIETYTGTWGQAQIMHLLRRTLFGLSQADYNYFSSMTLAQCVQRLLTVPAAPSPPVNVYNTSAYTDPNVPSGQTWVNAAYTDGIADGGRIESLKAWWVGNMVNQDQSITEKMILFWHNNFATQTQIVLDARYSYLTLSLFRANVLGNYQTLTQAITTDPAMLVYLNGNTNTVGAPNENYGRELQEIFTVGKQPNGDTLYTQSDVEAAAKVLTGWTDDATTISSKFVVKNHDTSNKQFSSFYNNTIIKGQVGANGANETTQLINMIFNSPQSQVQVAQFFCRKLYYWFVYYDIDSTVETNVIAPLAQVLIDNNFEVAPVLQTLLSSAHFFDPINMGCYIKNPPDHVVGVCRQFNVALPVPASTTDITGLTNQYLSWVILESLIATMAMDIGDPPNVAGWAAYYVSPEYEELWINTDTLPLRNQVTDGFSGGATLDGITFAIDFLAFTTSLSNPSDPNQLIADSTAILSPNAFDPVETAFLLSILLSGQSATYYWTDAWNAYIASPTNTQLKSVVLTPLTQYYAYVMERAEYQLI